VRLSRRNGLEALRRVREIDHQVGIVLVTVVNEEETGWQALRLGAFDGITKSRDLEYLERSPWCKTTTATL